MQEPNFIGTILWIALGLIQISKESSKRTNNCSVTHQVVRGWSLKNRACQYPAETDTICVHLYLCHSYLTYFTFSWCDAASNWVRASNCKIHPLTLVPLPTAELSSCTQYSLSRCQVLSNVNWTGNSTVVSGERRVFLDQRENTYLVCVDMKFTASS